MKIVAVYNFKGGVGKTSTVVHLAALAARDGHRTLLWDLDPQAAASYVFRVESRQRVGARKLLAGERELAELVRETDWEHLALLPADLSFRKLDVALAEVKRPSERLAGLIRPLIREFDLLFFDCPPSLSLLAEAVFAMADLLVVPLVPAPLSLRALSQLHAELVRKGLGDLAVAPFLSMVDRRKSLHRDSSWLSLRSPYPLLETAIPYSTLVEEVTVRRQPVFAFAPASPPAVAYERLWAEVKGRL
ncbi:MAG TPA: AAA family ATPase [Thermoanaerobaculia bacterium]|nr:AAA family ATPase [Thermoanaerobaculia bacterium]